MTKISKKAAYPVKIPVRKDYFVGTDSENNGKTVNFEFESTAKLINELNGTPILNYIFRTDSNIDLTVLTEGVFLSAENETTIANISKLYINKNNFHETNMSDLFRFVSVNRESFLMKLRNSSNLSNAVYFRITDATEFESYFILDVAVEMNNASLPELTNFNVYFFDFELSSSDLAITLPEFNKIVTQTGYTSTETTITFNPSWTWLIKNVSYENSASVVKTIAPTSVGKKRIDSFVLNTSGTFQVVTGTETIGSPIQELTPIDTLYVTFCIVGDAGIESVEPIDISELFVLKQESYDFLVSYYDAVIEQVDLNDHRAVLNFMGTNTDVKSIALSGEFMRNGKIFTFKNHNATPLTIWHNSGTGNVKLLFPNEENFILQPKEVIQFSLNYYDTSIPRLEYIGIISSGGGIGLPIAITDVTGLTEELADRYTKSEVDAKVSSVYKFKGNVANYAALPATGLTIGDVYNLLDTGANYAWTGTVWDKLGDTIDISGKEDLSNKSQDIEADKTSTTKFGSVKAFYDWCVGRFQPKLVAGTNISIDNTNPLAPVINASGGGILAVREISASTTLASTDNGLVIIVRASCIVTIPNGLAANFECTLVTLNGVTVTVVKGTSVVLLNNTDLTLYEKLSVTLKNTLTANEYLTTGNL